MPTWTVDFKDLQSTIDEIIGKLEDRQKVESSAKSDLVEKYKKLYQASIEIETLKQRKSKIEQSIELWRNEISSIDSKITELNELFTN